MSVRRRANANEVSAPPPADGAALSVFEDAMKLPPKHLGAAEARHRQSLFISIAGLYLILLPVEAYIVGRFDLRLVLTHLTMSLAFVVASILTRRHGSIVANVLDLTLSIASSGFMVLVVVLTGGSRSPFLPWCLVMPVAVALVARRQIRDSALSSLICGLSTIFFVWAGHADHRNLVAWTFLVFTTSFVSVSSSLLQVRVLNTVARLGHTQDKRNRRRAQSECQRMEARRFALIGQLAAGIAHEVNNPLAVVKANLGFARNELESRSQEAWCSTVVDSLGDAAGGVERIRLLVRELADLSPPRTAATEECKPEDLIADAVETISLPASVTITSHAMPGIPQVRGVRQKLVEILRSLLHNGVDAVELLPIGVPRRVVIRASSDAFGVRFDVEDTGAGFSDSVLLRLFDPFFTTKPIGSGRGLNLAKAREHVVGAGGSISAENLPKGGARLIVRLPAAIRLNDSAKGGTPQHPAQATPTPLPAAMVLRSST
jgi:signal transduction histidine kinase